MSIGPSFGHPNSCLFDYAQAPRALFKNGGSGGGGFATPGPENDGLGQQ